MIISYTERRETGVFGRNLVLSIPTATTEDGEEGEPLDVTVIGTWDGVTYAQVGDDDATTLLEGQDTGLGAKGDAVLPQTALDELKAKAKQGAAVSYPDTMESSLGFAVPATIDYCATLALLAAGGQASTITDLDGADHHLTASQLKTLAREVGGARRDADEAYAGRIAAIDKAQGYAELADNL